MGRPWEAGTDGAECAKLRVDGKEYLGFREMSFVIISTSPSFDFFITFPGTKTYMYLSKNMRKQCLHDNDVPALS